MCTTAGKRGSIRGEASHAVGAYVDVRDIVDSESHGTTAMYTTHGDACERTALDAGTTRGSGRLPTVSASRPTSDMWQHANPDRDHMQHTAQHGDHGDHGRDLQEAAAVVPGAAIEAARQPMPMRGVLRAAEASVLAVPAVAAAAAPPPPARVQLSLSSFAGVGVGQEEGEGPGSAQHVRQFDRVGVGLDAAGEVPGGLQEALPPGFGEAGFVEFDDGDGFLPLEDGQGVSGQVHSDPSWSPTPPDNVLGAASMLGMSPAALPPPWPPSAAAAPAAPPLQALPHPRPLAHQQPRAASPTAPSQLFIPHDPAMPPPHTPHAAVLWPRPRQNPFSAHIAVDDRPALALEAATPDAARAAWAARESLDGSGPLAAAHRAHIGPVPVGYSATRRKRGSCDSQLHSLDAAEAARSAAQLVAASGSTPRHAAWERGATSGPLEECLHSSACGSTRMSAQSEPLQTARNPDSNPGGSIRPAGFERRSPRTTGFAAAVARRSLLRQRSGAAARLASARRALRGVEAERASSGALADVAVEDRMVTDAQQGPPAAAALPPLTAMEGRLRPLPKCPLPFHAREGAARTRLTRHSFPHVPCESIREGAAEALGSDDGMEPRLAAEAIFGAAFPQLDTPCGGDAAPGRGAQQAAVARSQGAEPARPHDAAAAGSFAEAQLRDAAAARARLVPQPATPFTTPRSPSPQRLCRRNQTPDVPSLAPPHGNQTPDLARALHSTERGPGNPAAGPVQAAGAQQLLRPTWMAHAREAEQDPEEQKRQLAVQRFNRELHCRLAAQGIGDGSEREAPPAPLAAAGPSQVRPRGPAAAERRRERQYVDKERLEEATLSALAALMKQ
eukprot:jgi/Ulvmu1/524/UM001_0532.1